MTMSHVQAAGKVAPAASRASLVLPEAICAAVLRGLDQVAGRLVALGISANAITSLCIALGATAGVLLAFGEFGIAAVAMVVASLGDALDGLVARRSGSVSVAGALLDASGDRYQASPSSSASPRLRSSRPSSRSLARSWSATAAQRPRRWACPSLPG
jgi:hypothetical protein